MIDAGELVRADVDDARAPLPEVFAELAPRVRRLAVQRVGENLADDVVQETFLRAYRAYDRYVEDGRSWPWVRNIAEHVCIDLVRRSRTEAAAVERVCSYRQPSVVDVDQTLASVEAREAREAMATVLAQLHPRQRRVLVLRDFHGWTNHEVAAALDMTIEGVKATLKRARSAFRVAYAGMAGGRYVAGVVGAVAAVRRALRRATTVGSAGSVNVVLVSALVVVTTLSLHVPVLPLDDGLGDGGRDGAARSASTQRSSLALGGYGRAGGGRAWSGSLRSGVDGGAAAAVAPVDPPGANSGDVVNAGPGAVMIAPPWAGDEDGGAVPVAGPGAGDEPPSLEVGTELSPTCGLVGGMEGTCAPLDTKVLVPVPPVEDTDSAPADKSPLPVPLPTSELPASPTATTNRSSSVMVRSDTTRVDDTLEPSPTEELPTAREVLTEVVEGDAAGETISP